LQHHFPGCRPLPVLHIGTGIKWLSASLCAPAKRVTLSAAEHDTLNNAALAAIVLPARLFNHTDYSEPLVKHCLLIILVTLIPFFAHAGKIGSDCTFNGMKLYGKVRVVNHFATFKVKVTRGIPDLKVRKVDAFPDGCGRWKFVEAFEDFSVQFVEGIADFSIKYVDAFPGV